MRYFVYQFEAISIQEYILTSSKLKEMVGASQLLENLTSDVLSQTIQSNGFEEKNPKKINEIDGKDVVFARRIGGVFLAIFKHSNKAETFAKTWPLVVQQFIPRLMFSCASAKGDNINSCLENIRLILKQQKNQPIAVLPESTPISQHNPLTQLSVIYFLKKYFVAFNYRVNNNFNPAN